MSIVSNTGPLIALAKADQLGLLTVLFGTVFIPPAVHRELLAKTGAEADRLDQVLGEWLTVAQRPELPPQAESELLYIDAGVREAVTLAQQMGLAVIMDDRLGRQAARRLGVTVTGTVGVVIEARRSELIPAVRPLLEDIQAQGYWLTPELIDLAVALAGE
jgi:predicted nucleic acid-binding protein